MGKAMDRNFTFLLEIFVLLLVHYDQMVMSLTNVNTDKSALVTLKSHLHLSPSHILSKNWSANSTSVCDWIGVTCNSRHQRVAVLDLSMMGLTGSIVQHLGNLSFLVSLNLSSNNFHGVVPPEFVRLRRLKVVDFNFNTLTGEIPPWFGSLSRLQILRLRNNSFSGFIPPSLSNASKLEILDLSFNPLQGQIPQEIGNLHNLKRLLLQYNQLSGFVPLTLFNLSKMELLSLVWNSLSGDLPGDMCRNLPKLERLSLSLNELYGQIPSNISECSQLQFLDLSGNNFGGHIPRGIGELRMLEIFYIFDNNLTGAIPEELGNLTILRELDMAWNQLAGRIPPQVFNISSLQYMRISRNNLSGMLPADMCSHLQHLEELYIRENEIFGPIPTRLYECSALRVLNLSFNKLNGPISPHIGNSTLLEIFSLTGNELTGEIPQEVGDLNNLEEIYLSWNILSGSIPLSLLNISTLRILSLLKNQLTGNLAPDLGYKLPNLEVLQFSENYLTSESSELSSFITSLTNCKYLTNLGMGENPLNGRLPASIGKLSTSLQKLYIDNCNLRGRIPEEIGNLSNLVVLSLNGNQLSGSLPKSLGKLLGLQGLFVSGNKISDTIPNTICRMKNLYELDLGGNQFYGAIPGCLGNSTSLRELYLNSNKLNSNTPASLWNLRELLHLDLSSNSLVGSVPPEMANLKAAVRIDLSLNQFSGVIPSAIVDLQTLSFLNLAHNKLQGIIPESVANMVNLENFNLSHNGLSGIIPKSLQKLQHLTSFDVSFNSLNGEIPADGPFKNFTFESFMFNKGLCGDPKYHVLPCDTSKFKRSNWKTKLRVLLISLGTSLVLLAVIFACIGITKYQRKDKTPIIPEIMHSLFGGTQFRVSYYELLAATEGYNESNLLGSGSFGSVYRGILRNGKNVAVKVFDSQLEGAFKSFEVECEVLRNLRHRNLCKVIGCCSNQDFKALVLEYMPCGSLEKWLYSHNHFLDVTQRISVMIDVASALDYLHQGYSAPVIHCDLKPSNILLDEDMTAHLCDFGVAKLLGDGESIVQTMTLATLSYIAPEYGTGGFVSVKCDVYSYGIVLMEVFTRKRPSDEIFTGNLSLRSWVKDSMPNALIDIVDSNLLRPGEDHGSNQKLDCLSSVMELGLNCSMESPHERMSIKDVIAALNKIKLQLLAI